MLRWPDAETVDRAVRRWAKEMARRKLEVVRIGYFGSYARGDWGVGSDLDLIVVVESGDLPLARRASEWDVSELPVPADLLVYTEEEWKARASWGRFGEALQRETIWVYERDRQGP